MNNDNLIDKLSSQLKPVKKLWPTKYRVLGWTALNILISLLIMQFVSPLSSLALEKFQSLELTLEIIFQFTSVAIVSYGALASTIPGAIKEKNLKYFFLPTIFLFFYFLIKLFLVKSYPVEFVHREFCYKEVIFISVIPIFHAYFLIFKGELWNKYVSIGLAVNSATLLLSSLMYINCMHAVNHSLHYHFLPSLLVTACTIIFFIGYEKIKAQMK